MEFYELALLSVWTLGVCSIFYIKSQLKVKDRALHDFVFGQSFTEYSSANSIRFLKIACSPKKWAVFDRELKLAFGFHLVMFLVFLLLFFGSFFVQS
jgi:hypothetical protein